MKTAKDHLKRIALFFAFSPVILTCAFLGMLWTSVQSGFLAGNKIFCDWWGVE